MIEEQKRYLAKVAMSWVKDKNPRIKFNKKEIDLNTLKVDGIDVKDYPDFTDAFFSYGVYTNNSEMTKEELSDFTNKQPYLLHSIIIQNYINIFVCINYSSIKIKSFVITIFIISGWHN